MESKYYQMNLTSDNSSLLKIQHETDSDCIRNMILQIIFEMIHKIVFSISGVLIHSTIYRCV